MNMSKVISSIMTEYALYQITLPFKDPTETVIMNILSTVTIPQYSEFVPWQRKEIVDVRHMQMIDKAWGIYILPATLTTPPIKDVINVDFPTGQFRGMYGDIATPFGVSRSIQGVLINNAYSTLIGEARAEPTFEYLGENRIKLNGFPRCQLEFTINSEHMPTGETIEETCYSSFMELASLDVQITLYNTLKLYDNLPTAFGTLSLKSDDYQAAIAEKKSLLKEWNETCHIDYVPWEFF